MAKNRLGKTPRLMLKGSLRKCGFDRWRIVTCGMSNVTGEECTFFFEFYIVNPALSPKECVLGFKNRFSKTAADLQYALAGTESAKTASAENFVQPSFIMVKAGILSNSGRHVNAYFPCGSLETDRKNSVIRVGQEGGNMCEWGKDFCKGEVSVGRRELNEHPEYLCGAGTITWNLHLDRRISAQSDYRGKTVSWICHGAKTNFSGVITVDGEDFDVSPRRSFGFMDKNWGKDFVSPFIHLSSNDFVSKITGHQLENSCFALQGEYDGTLSVFTNLEGLSVEFNAGRKKKYFVTYGFTETSENGERSPGRLHGSVSVHNRKYVLDIDIYCDPARMFLRDYESPVGGRKVLRVGSGIGTGELRLYRRVSRNLELIEHVEIMSCLSEYGNIELPSV